MIYLLLQSYTTQTKSSHSSSTLPPLFLIIRRLLLSKRWRQLLFLLILSLFTICSIIAQECRVSTLAGNSTSGSIDGIGEAAQFNRLFGIIIIDEQGNIYVADFNNHQIRKVDANGLVTTIAGSGTDGFLDGPAETAQFNNPAGVTVDGQGNVYVADAGNRRIRKIDTNGQVTTLAGSGINGFMDGSGDVAQFKDPIDVAVDLQGNVYVADHDDHRVRKVAANGQVTTLAGTGPHPLFMIGGFMDGPRETAQF